MNFINIENIVTEPITVDYSDIPACVDESDYRPDAEQLRSLKITGQVSSVSPVYDSDGDINAVTDDVVMLRQGKLDKAEVETLRKNIIDSAVADGEKAHANEVSKAIDNTLGIGNVEGN